MRVWELGQKPLGYHWCQPEGLERCFQTNPHLSFTSSSHQQPSLSETTLFLASVRDLFASRNLKVILKDKVKFFSAVTPCQFTLSTNYRPQNSGLIQRGKIKERGGGEMFWQPSSHQWNWRKPYHMNHLKIRSVWTQPWKMYHGEQACIGGGMNRMR